MHPYHLIMNKILKRNFAIISTDDIVSKINDDSKQYFVLENNKPYATMRGKRKNDVHYVACHTIQLDCPLNIAIEYMKEYEFLLVCSEEKQYLGYLWRESLVYDLAYELECGNAYLQTILDTINESCTVIDAEQNVVYWTKGAESIFSVSGENIIGKPITQFFKEDQLEILHTLQHRKSVYQQQHFPREDLVVMINSNPVMLHDKTIGAVVAETDITHVKKLNEELHLTSEKLLNLEKQMNTNGLAYDPFTLIRGNSPKLKEVLEKVKKVAETEANILIYGESGVGKELFARAVHAIREKPEAPFVAINCGAIPSGLFESEIFGYEKGAFSGAHQKGKKGKVELARGGTLFLDEIGEMPLEMQVKILRLLQEKTFYTVGGTKEMDVEFNLVAATNRDLKQLVAEGKFREDLYYRLNVVNFTVPPLRERASDILEISNYFLYEKSIKYNRPIQGIPTEIANVLLKYQWPGNVRELSNVIERLVVFSDEGAIHMEDLPTDILATMPKDEKLEVKRDFPLGTELNNQLEHYEREIILEQLAKVNGNKKICAKNLGITRATLYNRLKKLNIDV
ncbi:MULTISPECIES: sigma 54-interacting transcriptional regulator [unclassified Lysinibacillus]|uniref:sigma-54 interaction domain-containing protein n=2 Tax=Lysinibacillus TaxID=400634 RepID=UPI000891489D|nr:MULTISPECIES: sigma 54-interacting transcriptional regulator [unclassified Lysinibacillus]SCY96932.1 PAS domain S-box-containing protein [Lysinibacillus sp. SG9]SDB45998.1 PAS domain S-box-containing protein [Lysinibacillus sp. TC-37]SFT11632.1 PAS domain S-box-containing protein [Lysinibacillus sp. SG55]